MKVLVLATDVFTRGGIARYTSALASSLGGILGPENVDVLCFFDWGYDGELPSNFRFAGAVSSKARAGAFSRLRFLLKATYAGMKGYDLVIANHVALAPVAWMIKRIFGTPYWVSCHSVEIWWGTSWMRQVALRTADCILPVSRYTANVVQKMRGMKASRVRVVYNAIPNSFSRLLRSQEHPQVPKMQDSGRIMLSVCSLVPGNEFKGVDTVIRALPAVLQKVPNLQYAIVGDGEIRSSLQDLARTVGVEKSVSFFGEISDEDLARLYRECDLFVLPSRGQQRAGVAGGEGFGRVYVEAAMAGRPVVGSRSGGAAEAVVSGKTGFLVDPDSSDEIVEAVVAILRNPELGARMGCEGRAWALDTFSEDALSRSLGELLRVYGFASEGMHSLAPAGGL